jgi:hypothetical protein
VVGDAAAIERSSSLSSLRGSLPGAVSASEELLQHGSEGFWGYVVRLTFQGAALRIGEDVRKR